MDENQNIEYKESWRDEYLKWICGFANAKGGKIYIGKEDAAPHKAVLLTDADKLMEDIPNKVRDVLGIMVDTNLLYENGMKYIEIVIEPQPYGVSYKGQFHYRSGSTKQELKGAALNKFLLERRGLQWDQVPVPGVTIEDLDRESMQAFRRKAVDNNRIDADVLNDTDEILLDNLNLFRNGLLTRAALLLFHPAPDKFFSNAYVKIGFFLSDDELMFQDEIHGSIMNQLEKTYDLIRTKYMAYAISYKGLDRKERAPFPEESLRESLLNALAHKSYAEPYPIQISVYPDHFVIWNAGELPGGWTVDNLRSKHPSMAFNPDIANALFRCGEIEAWGRGIKKIMDKSIEYRILPPVFDTSFGGLMITFYSNPTEQMRQDGYDERSTSIVEYTFDKGRITNKDVQKLLNVSRATAFRLLSKLDKYLAQVGETGKNTYYVVKGFTNASTIR